MTHRTTYRIAAASTGAGFANVNTIDKLSRPHLSRSVRPDRVARGQGDNTMPVPNWIMCKKVFLLDGESELTVMRSRSSK